MSLMWYMKSACSVTSLINSFFSVFFHPQVSTIVNTRRKKTSRAWTVIWYKYWKCVHYLYKCQTLSRMGCYYCQQVPCWRKYTLDNFPCAVLVEDIETLLAWRRDTLWYLYYYERGGMLCVWAIRLLVSVGWLVVVLVVCILPVAHHQEPPTGLVDQSLYLNRRAETVGGWIGVAQRALHFLHANFHANFEAGLGEQSFCLSCHRLVWLLDGVVCVNSVSCVVL